GSPRIHIAVWTTSAERAGYLRSSLPEDADSEKLKALRDDLRDAIVKVLEASTISWCQILEDRPEIISRRDMGSLMAWFVQKKVLIVGCGALGSWATEIVARAGAAEITLVDNNIVKPGVLARQNFMLEDIGANKAKALARRICAIAARCTVHEQSQE
ncbi:UBA/THIF-type NAD/FAD binding protein, partial [mine drainage metagenome]